MNAEDSAIELLADLVDAESEFDACAAGRSPVGAPRFSRENLAKQWLSRRGKRGGGEVESVESNAWPPLGGGRRSQCVLRRARPRRERGCQQAEENRSGAFHGLWTVRRADGSGKKAAALDAFTAVREGP